MLSHHSNKAIALMYYGRYISKIRISNSMGPNLVIN